MKRRILSSWVVASIALITLAVARASADELPPAATGRVDFNTQIKPMLQGRCLTCHARGKFKGGLSLETRESLLRGGEEGPAAVVGKSGESHLVRLIAGLEEGRRMPQKGPALSREEIGLFRAWIDQGLAWPTGLSFGFRQAPLAPRNPELPAPPAGVSLESPIDRLIAGSLAKQGVTLDWNPTDDRAFARRVSLDLVGLLPSRDRLAKFEQDESLNKRYRFVEELLNNRRDYAEHWLTFWNDALRNAYKGTGFIDGGRKTITGWLFQALYENKPYNAFVRELVSPVPGSEGFTKGIVWRGVVNASQVPPVQAAQNLSQVFLGTNLKCASCHDSFVNHWKLSDAYSLASVFSDKPLEVHRCDKPTGETSTVGFVYPSLGTIDPNASRAERMKRLAELLVTPENGRLSRTIVNRLWAHLIGRGIVEPLDDMDQPPWDQDLLDWLATDFVAHGYDLKHTLALICTSKAYQLRTVGLPEPSNQSAYVFRGPQIKRMSAEQFSDALSSVAGVWPEASNDMIKVDGRGQGGQLAAIRAAIKGEAPTGDSAKVSAQWVWSHANARNDPGGRILIRKLFRIDALPSRAVAVATCDNELVLFVNGKRVAAGAEWSRPVTADITKLLKVGENVIAAEATNWPDPAHSKGEKISGPNPAAFIAWVGGFEEGKLAWGVGSDATWLWSAGDAEGWRAQTFNASGWKPAVELPGAGQLYSGVDLASASGQLSALSEATPLRAVLTFDDPLLAALGRTSREQVVTRRESVATTLQALELINGLTLDRKLRGGAKVWFDREGNAPDALARKLYISALGRVHSNEELGAATSLLGTPVSVEGVQDLLWSVAMLPEFQLIR